MRRLMGVQELRNNNMVESRLRQATEYLFITYGLA